MSVRLFIGNLPYAASEAELREHLSSVGEPAQIVLPTDRETGRPRGFAFVDYVDRAVAEEAIRRYNQQPFKGRPLAVSEARPREDRPPGPRPGGFTGPRPGAPGGFSGGGGGGGFGAPRPGGFSRPPDAGTGGPRSRNFGPDAPPKNKRKPPRKDDRGPKGPIKARPVTTLYDEDEDWRAKDEEPVEIYDIAKSKPGAAEDGDGDGADDSVAVDDSKDVEPDSEADNDK
ncbi:MAG: RNA-binding protein [Acidobacteria bacterium]|nr:RNA-binding protein [Acidobacteriota bacterium]